MRRSKKIVIGGFIALFSVAVVVAVILLIVFNRPQEAMPVASVETPAAAINAIEEASVISPEGFTRSVPAEGTYGTTLQLASKQYSVEVPSEAAVVYTAGNDTQEMNSAAVLQASQEVFMKHGFTANGSGESWAQFINQSVLCRVDVQAEARATASFACVSTKAVNDEYAVTEELLGLQTILPVSGVSAVQLRTHEAGGVTGALVTTVYTLGDDEPLVGYQLFYAKQDGNEWRYITSSEVQDTTDGKPGSTEALRAELNDPQWNGVLLYLAGGEAI